MGNFGAYPVSRIHGIIFTFDGTVKKPGNGAARLECAQKFAAIGLTMVSTMLRTMLGRRRTAANCVDFPAARALPAMSGQPAIESLEARTFFSVGTSGVIVGEQLIGPEAACTGIVLQFNEHLNPATANNVKAYAALRLLGEVTGHEPRVTAAGVASIQDASPDRGFDMQKVILASAVYNDTNLTVTLTPASPFDAAKYLNVIQVAGSGSNAVLDAARQPIDGSGGGSPGSDAVIKFKSRKARQITYRNPTGDKVTLKLSGPGTMHVLLRRNGDLAPIVFVVGANPSKSTLTGTVLKGSNGAGIAVIQQLVGAGTVQNNLASNPAFQIQAT